MAKYSISILIVLLLGVASYWYMNPKVVYQTATKIERFTDTMFVKGKDIVKTKLVKHTDTVWASYGRDSLSVWIDTTVSVNNSTIKVYTDDLFKDGLIVDANIFEAQIARVDTIKIKDSVKVFVPEVRGWYDKPSIWMSAGAICAGIIIKILK